MSRSITVTIGSKGDVVESTRKPSKEYRARIWVRLTEDILPQPVMSATDLQEHLTKALGIGEDDSPFTGVTVEDPRNTSKPRRY